MKIKFCRQVNTKGNSEHQQSRALLSDDKIDNMHADLATENGTGVKQSDSLAENRDWHLYILRTADNRLYTGITTCIERRFKQHQSGSGAKALRNAGELILVYQIKTAGHSEALKMEYRIKQLTKAKKEKLVKDQPSIEQLTMLLNH